MWRTHVAAWYIYHSSSHHGHPKGVGFGFIKMVLTFQLMKGQIVSSENLAAEGKGREGCGRARDLVVPPSLSEDGNQLALCP